MCFPSHYRQQIAKPELVENAWLKDLPVADMARFGWLTPQPKASERLAACLFFFGVPNVATWHRVCRPVQQEFAFRTSPSFESHPAAVSAWLRQGEILAQKGSFRRRGCASYFDNFCRLSHLAGFSQA